jgi:hypothetical protein
MTTTAEYRDGGRMLSMGAGHETKAPSAYLEIERYGLQRTRAKIGSRQ